MGKPSPLAQVTEENIAPRLYTGGDANQDAFAQNSAASERDGNLITLGTPIGPGESFRSQEPQGQVKDADIQGALSETLNKDLHVNPTTTGLGVDGIDEMKSVEI